MWRGPVRSWPWVPWPGLSQPRAPERSQPSPRERLPFLSTDLRPGKELKESWKLITATSCICGREGESHGLVPPETHDGKRNNSAYYPAPGKVNNCSGQFWQVCEQAAEAAQGSGRGGDSSTGDVHVLKRRGSAGCQGHLLTLPFVNLFQSHHDKLAQPLILTAYIVIFLTGLPANLLALRAFIGRVRQPHPAPVHILLLSLTLADLLLLLLLPFKMIEAAYDFRWYLPELLCALTGFGFYSSIYCSTWLLAGISIERYLGVAFPVQYKLSRKPVYGVIAAVIAWVMSFGHCTIVIIGQYWNSTRNATSENGITCYENFTKAQLDVVLPVRLELCLFLFFVPMVITIFCYWRFVWIMLTQPHVGAQRRRRAVGLAVVTLLNFLVCFGPYNVSHLVGFFTKKSPLWRAEAVVFSSLNASLDPLLFYFSSSAVRRAFGRGLQILRHQSASLLGRRGKETTEGTSGDRGVSQAEGAPSSDFTTE